jgi:hypothetical protein
MVRSLRSVAVRDPQDSDRIFRRKDVLQDNLAKVEQHGRRADSIVRNMLLHSREGGGEHRPSDINALVTRASTSPITAPAPRNPTSRRR